MEVFNKEIIFPHTPTNGGIVSVYMSSEMGEGGDHIETHNLKQNKINDIKLFLLVISFFSIYKSKWRIF